MRRRRSHELSHASTLASTRSTEDTPKLRRSTGSTEDTPSLRRSEDASKERKPSVNVQVGDIDTYDNILKILFE